MPRSEFRPEDLSRLRQKIRENPRWFTRVVLGEDSWETQDQILDSVRDNIRTAVMACHAPGKTRGAARVVPWFLFSFKNSKVITTAPTWRQVEKLLWAEIRGIIHAAPYELGLQLPPKAAEAFISDNWYAIGLSTNQPERFQGFHAPAILIIVDEASGVEDGIFEAIQGIMASGAVVRILLLSNTTRGDGYFYNACTSGSGLWNVIKIRALDTPNFAGIKDAYLAATSKEQKLAILRSVPDSQLVRSYLVKPSWMADLMQEFGEDSSVFQIRAMSEFPGEQPDQMFPLHLCERAQILWDKLTAKHWWQTQNGELLRKVGWQGLIDLGIDVARYGDSESGIAPMANGIVAPLITWKKTPATQTAGRVIQVANRLQANRVKIDDDGVGGPVLDMCREAGVSGIIPFRGGMPARNKKRYLNARAEAYFELKDGMEKDEIALPIDPKLAGQLSILRYWLNSQGQLCISTKEQLREEGKASPDRGDMVMMAKSNATAGTIGSKPAGW